MFFQLPPALPAASPMQTAQIETAAVVAECEKGSRDCFPADRVGIVTESATESVIVLTPNPSLAALGMSLAPADQLATDA